jgi:hypothetical protein
MSWVAPDVVDILHRRQAALHEGGQTSIPPDSSNTPTSIWLVGLCMKDIKDIKEPGFEG